MRRRIVPFAVVSSIPCLFLAAGCDEGHPPVDSSRTEARVKGIVKIKGKPAEGGGNISFNPSNVERKVVAFTTTVEPDGSYSLKTFTGGNVVKFSGPFLKSEPGLALTSRYCELKSGDNTVDFDLLGEGDKPSGTAYSLEASRPGAKKKGGR
jgi:hypothetical protein